MTRRVALARAIWPARRDRLGPGVSEARFAERRGSAGPSRFGQGAWGHARGASVPAHDSFTWSLVRGASDVARPGGSPESDEGICHAARGPKASERLPWFAGLRPCELALHGELGRAVRGGVARFLAQLPPGVHLA